MLPRPLAALVFDACGFRSFWINRSGAPVDELGAAPDCSIGGLDELPALMRRARS